MSAMGDETQTDGLTTRRKILQIALTLMAQRGVDGTSMRDLASACDLNVASLYHYFPSKRELLEAVLVERGYFPVRHRWPGPGSDPTDEGKLANMLWEILVAVFEVEDFVRLMVGEAMRDEVTARAVGLDLFTTFQVSMEEWILKHRPDLDEASGAGEVSRLLTAMVVGTFVQHAAGVIADEGEDLRAILLKRARETARVIGVAN
jgi:AcrR family transcriptional regulator